MFGCNSTSKKPQNEQIIQSSSKVNIHNLIDLALAERMVFENQLYTVEYNPIRLVEIEKDIRILKDYYDLPEGKINSIKVLLDNPTKFEFEQLKLNESNKNLLNKKNKDSKERITFFFNGFAIDTINNISSTSLTVGYFAVNTTQFYGGHEELIFFKMENDIWKISESIQFIEY